MIAMNEVRYSAAGRSSAQRADPLDAAVRVWLALGIAAVLCVPALRGTSAWFGWLPFWLVVAPLIDLAVLRRQRLAAASRAFLVSRSRRRRAAPRQARSLRRRARSLRSAGNLLRVSP
ncbi:MAG TPA: hypothetical protein VF132_02710 [Rudaea sp.]